MSITQLNPRTIILAGGEVVIDDILASEAITPGHLVELFSASAGVNKWRKNSSATNITPMFVAINQPELNLGLETACAAGDLIPVAALEKGDIFYGLLPSGQNIANGDLLQSNGDGTMKAATDAAAAANVAKFQALDNIGAITVQTRVRVQVI